MLIFHKSFKTENSEARAQEQATGRRRQTTAGGNKKEALLILTQSKSNGTSLFVVGSLWYHNFIYMVIASLVPPANPNPAVYSCNYSLKLGSPRSNYKKSA